MRIAVDENIPGADDAFGQFGTVTTFAGRALVRADLADVDALVVRSVTRVDASLLDGTPVRFVGTATIGTDHLDLPWLDRQAITFADAAGCNSRSVSEYVVAALLELRDRGGLRLDGETLGIVGMGRIGRLVASSARTLGMRVVAYDPPRARHDRFFTGGTLADVLSCRVVTLHVPLTVGCADPTWHLVDASFLERMRSDAVLVNTSRGAVVQRRELVAALRRGLIAGAVLDVWEGEPEIPEDLVRHATLVTPHVAGYSYDGKVAGTAMIAEALARHLGVPDRWRLDALVPARAGTIEVPDELRPLDAALHAVRRSYDIRADDAAIRATHRDDDAVRHAAFDKLRRTYPIRREFAAYAIEGSTDEARSMLAALGFGVAGAG